MSSVSSKKRNNPYILITRGPTGSGKSSLIDKSIDYLKLERPLDKNIFIIDNLVEQNPDYKNKTKKILKKYFSESDYTVIEKKIKNFLIHL
jgi:predicted KAP-like P-loop ATPase